ncbi:ABC transporter substrate-binding protein [Balneatrix alpica]|uniref:ABC transporter substrate-binding protein n=1 Tax=Balneatrix alpica TaxID=75684 RepID=A0ABV5ZF69_9GAMM|nr:ABC transporter substrate-binding protein [Balneatrix alpica]
MQKRHLAWLTGTLFATSLSYTPVSLAACEVDKPVRFAGMNWGSNLFIVEVSRLVLEKGYECKTDVIPGGTIPMMQALVRGDVDLMAEVWMNTVAEAWNKGIEQQSVKEVGDSFEGGLEAWFVPRYLVEGDSERGIEPLAPELRSVADLPKYKDLFQDPESPEQGRFYNCPSGWMCEVVNSNKLKAYGLDAHYTNFRPGTGAALKAAIATNYKRGKPVLFYYWGPTEVLGKYDLIQLQEPQYDKAIFDQLITQESEATSATAYPIAVVKKGVNTGFAAQAPNIIDFYSKMSFNNADISSALAYMDDNELEPKDAALHFMQQREDLWRQWVPEEVAGKIKAGLE